MERKKSRISLISLVLQLAVTVFYVIMMLHTAIALGRKGNLSRLVLYVPLLIVLGSSLMLQVILWVKHKSYLQEDIMPVLSLFVSFLSITMLPLYSESTGVWLLTPDQIAIITRFVLLTTDVLFVFSALQYYGINNSRMRLYLAVSIGGAAFLSLQLPLNTGSANWEALYFSSVYDGYFVVMLIIIAGASVFTYLSAVIKDRATHDVSKAAGSSLLIISILATTGSTNTLTSLAFAVVFLLGIVLIATSNSNNPW